MIAEFDSTDRVALVTGAGRGIGTGIAEVLAEAGATVVPNALTGRYVESAARAISERTGRIAVAFTRASGVWTRSACRKSRARTPEESEDVMFYQRFEDGKKDPQATCTRTEILPKDVAPHISAGLVEIPIGGYNDSNPHFDKTQIYFVLEGKGTFFLDGKKALDVEAEAVVEVPIGVRHMMRADKGTPVRYVYVNDPLKENG